MICASMNAHRSGTCCILWKHRSIQILVYLSGVRYALYLVVTVAAWICEVMLLASSQDSATMFIIYTLAISNSLQHSRFPRHHSASYFEAEALYSHMSSRSNPKRMENLAGYCKADTGCPKQPAWTSASPYAYNVLAKATYKYCDHDSIFNVCQLRPSYEQHVIHTAH